MLTTLPLECFVCREVMENYYFPNEHWQPNRHLIFTTSLVVSAIVLSLLTCDLGAVFELIGATSACVLAFILPPLCYIKLSTRSWRTYAAIGCAIFGLLVLIISLVQAIIKLLNGMCERFTSRLCKLILSKARTVRILAMSEKRRGRGFDESIEELSIRCVYVSALA